MNKWNVIFGCVALFFSTLLASQPIESEKLFTSATYGALKLSPDGQYITSYFREDDEHFISLFDRETNELKSQLNVGKKNSLKAYAWLNEAQLYFNIETQGRDFDIIGDLEDGQINARVVKASGFLVNTLPDQPKKVMYAKQRGKYLKKYDVYIITVEDLAINNFKKAKKIAGDSESISNVYYDAKFKRLITTEFDEENEILTVKDRAVSGNKWRKLIEIKSEEYRFEPLDFIAENKMAVLSDKETDKLALYEFDINTQELGKIVYQHPKYDLISAGFSADGSLSYVTYKQHGLVKYRYFDKSVKKFLKRLANTFENQEFYFVDRTKDEKLYLLYVNGSGQPGEYFIFNNQGVQLNRLLAAYPDLVDHKFSTSQHINVKAKDGTIIEAFLTLPTEIDHSTLLVIPHGGPIDVQESDRFNKEVQFYASRGFAVLRVNFRGSSGFGKSFMKDGVGEFGRLIEEDITAAVNTVTAKHQFKHMCAMGASYGGYSAAMLAIREPERYDCVVGAFGIYDLPLTFNASNWKATEEFRELNAKTVGEFDKSMVDFSPVYLSKALKAPMLIIAGRNDKTADFEHSSRMKYVLEKNNQPVESFFYKNAPHGHKQWTGDRHEAALTYDFLMRTLNLKEPQFDALSDTAQKAIADDYAHVADGYEFGYERKVNNSKAMSYYRKASDYGHGRASFNIAASYQFGSGVEKDLSQSFSYYEKSVAQGYENAYGRLGKMYMEGEHVEQNWQLAFDNLTKAQESDYPVVNKILLGRFYCTAPEEFKDVDKCLELFDIEQYEKHSNSRKKKAIKESRKALAWVIADGKFTPDEKKKIQALISDMFNVNHFSVSLDIDEEGEFIFQESSEFGEDGEYVLVDESFKVQAKDHNQSRFGVKFNVDSPGIDSYKDRTAVVVRWIRKNLDGTQSIYDSWILYGTTRSDWSLLENNQNIKKAGTWTLEIYDLDQNRIYSRQYQVTPLEESKADIGS